jgi:GNAT superfamily N-acetyltransferase
MFFVYLGSFYIPQNILIKTAFLGMIYEGSFAKICIHQDGKLFRNNLETLNYVILNKYEARESTLTFWEDFMDQLEEIFNLDFAYLTSFTQCLEREWGILFYNEEQPDYYDANHAHIRRLVEKPDEVIKEVFSFYQSKGLLPRFYIYNLDVQGEFISQLKDNHFGYEELISPVQLWDKKIIESSNIEEVTIELVTMDNFSEALDIECSIKEFGGRAVREKAFQQEFHNPQFTYYLLRYKGEACATACLFTAGNQARVESVATLEEYRGKGLIGHLIRHIQSEAAKRDIANLWVFPINEKIEKIYHKYGFHTLEKLKMGHAFFGGKSIKEIQG